MGDPAAMNATYYDRVRSARWEEELGQRPSTPASVSLLAELANGRPVLEFGIGTGRLSLPLQERGLQVQGIDSSEWMIAELRKKPGGDRLPVTLGDFVTTMLDDRFGLVFLASQTLFAVTTQAGQVECFRNAARHLDPGGHFLIEVLSPHSNAVEHESCLTMRLDVDHVLLLASRVDIATQEMQQCFIYIRDGELPWVRPSASRFAYPGELDLMAQMAGLKLSHRWGGWDKRPFTATSESHISVYVRC